MQLFQSLDLMERGIGDESAGYGKTPLTGPTVAIALPLHLHLQQFDIVNWFSTSTGLFYMHSRVCGELIVNP
jgi:hypothetical protein